MPPILTQRDGRVGRLTLNRPEALNAITTELATQLGAGLEALALDCDAIVVRGAGGTFCVGGDFHELERLRQEGPEATLALFTAFARACAAIGSLEVPVVAVVEGHALAGGFELALACDVVLVAEDAKLADNHANFAQVPGGGGSQLLPRLVGRQRAGAHMLTGDRLSGHDAVAWGLAYRAVPADQLDAAAEQLVDRLIGPGKSREAQARTKRLIRDGLELGLEDGLELERRTVVEHLTGEAAAVGIDAFHNRGRT